MHPSLEEGDLILGVSPFLENSSHNRCLSIRMPILNNSIHKCDIVTFKIGDSTFVKRVVGLPGDTIHFSDGIAFINNSIEQCTPLIFIKCDVNIEKSEVFNFIHDEIDSEWHYISKNKIRLALNLDSYLTLKARFKNEIRIIENVSSKHTYYDQYIVGKDSVFVLGDNRMRSYDSRYFGPIPYKIVTSKVISVYK